MFFFYSNKLNIESILKNRNCNKIIIRTLFKSVAGKVATPALTRTFATGDQYSGHYKIPDKLTRDKYEKRDFNVKALEKYCPTSVEDDKGNFNIDHTATHSSSVKLKNGTICPSTKISDRDYKGFPRKQYISRN
jgi:hypothetical protein